MWLLDVIKPNTSLIVQDIWIRKSFISCLKLKLGLRSRDLAIRFNLNEENMPKPFEIE